MDKRKIEILIAIVVILGLIIALVILFSRPGQETPDTPGDVVSPPIPERVSTVDSRTVESPPDVIARSFVERLGSYSTDVNYLNVDDVKALATAALTLRLEDLVAEARRAVETGFYGVSTQVITVTSIEETETVVTLLMKTQRTETFDTPANTSVRYQDVEVTLSKNGSRWLVDDFTWIE